MTVTVTGPPKYYVYLRLWLHKQLVGDIMKKQRKKSFLPHQLLQKGCSMATQKKQIVSATRSKGRKGRRISSKSGMIVRMVPHRKPSQTASFRKAVERSVATAKKKGNPIAKYDIQRRQAYLEYPDGKRTYVE